MTRPLAIALNVARRDLALAKAWMNDKGHTLDCGAQDAALDHIRDLEARVRDLEAQEDADDFFDTTPVRIARLNRVN